MWYLKLTTFSTSLKTKNIAVDPINLMITTLLTTTKPQNRPNRCPAFFRVPFGIGLLSALFCTNSVNANDFLQTLSPNKETAASSNDLSAHHSYIHYGVVALLDEHNKGDNANIGVLIGQQSIAIIDSGGSPIVTEQLLTEIEAISKLPVSHIIITHAHPDHWMGLPLLMTKTNAQLLVNQNFAAALEQRKAEDIARLSDAIGTTSTLDDLNIFALENYADRVITIDEPITISLGQRDLKLQNLPVSHTDNDLIVWDESQHTLWAGDLFFVEHLPTFEAKLKGLQDSRKIIENYAADLVVPGHGQPNPGWQEKWQKQWQYFDTLSQDVREKISAGASLQTTIAEAEHASEPSSTANQTNPLNDWKLVTTFHPRNVTRAYQALEWD